MFGVLVLRIGHADGSHNDDWDSQIAPAVFYCTPCLTASCPAYEPNSNDGEYSHPFCLSFAKAPSGFKINQIRQGSVIIVTWIQIPEGWRH